MSVIDILLEKKLISKDDVKEIRKQISGGSTVDEALLAKGVKPEDIVIARGEFLNIPARSVSETSIPFEVLDYIPEIGRAHV